MAKLCMISTTVGERITLNRQCRFIASKYMNVSIILVSIKQFQQNLTHCIEKLSTSTTCLVNVDIF